MLEGSNGEIALARTAAYSPDLVPLDVVMPPRKHAIQVCQQLKPREAMRLIPAVIVTAPGTLGDRIRGTEASAVDVLSKPFGVRD